MSYRWLSVLALSYLPALAAPAPEHCPGYSAQDPYSLDVRFTDGPNRGRCIDLSVGRPVHVLTEDEARPFTPSAGEKLVANFHHRGRFWIARIPAQAVAEVLFQTERFDPPGDAKSAGVQINQALWFSAHAQLRFRMKEGKDIVLMPQDKNSENPDERVRLRDIIVSSEAVTMPGDSFNLLKGEMGSFALAKRFTSLDEKIQSMIVEQKHVVRQDRIRAGDSDAEVEQNNQLFLETALRRSERDYQSYRRHEPVAYNTLQASCVTDAFGLFDEADHFGLLQNSALSDLFKRNPTFIPGYLAKRGLIEPLEVLNRPPTLNQEFGYKE
ncbi:MAG: hypothetical protein JST16_09095 [Bdellovibrionales bacterium]|nr:hypothetical protein [Bdellovibrionales bacterium]